MNISNIPPEILDAGLRAADTALLTAIFKHACQNQPEIARMLIADATKLIPTESGFANEDSVGLVAKHALKNRLDSMLSELLPRSQIRDGFQQQVR